MKTTNSSLRTLKLIWACIILLTGNFACSQTRSNSTPIDDSINSYMQQNHILGLSACLIKEGEMVFSKSYGVADLQNNVPMSIDGIMNIGSISKTFTGTAAMQLWERGLIKLDTDINEYLDFEIRNPEYPDKAITVHQILTHTSSIGDGDAYRKSYSCGDPSISLDEWIRNYFTPNGNYYNPEENFNKWEPGSKSKYSNVAFGVLGLIVEKVSKQSFSDYCKKNIFEPLGMSNTGWYLSDINVNQHIKPYIYVSNKEEERSYLESNLYPNKAEISVGNHIEPCLYSFPNFPDGLIRTSVTELSFFLTALMNGGELNGSRILNKETLDKMLTLPIERDNDVQGLVFRKYTFESTWGHPGGDPGIKTRMIFNREKRTGVIIFQNTNNGGDNFEIASQLYLMDSTE